MSTRIRTVKPELFRHELLFEAEQETGLPLRIAFIGLFCCCDREGRFEWRPRQLKLDVLPYDNHDFSRVLDALATRGLIVKYRVDGSDYGCIPTFKRHQVINNRERESELPSPDDGDFQHTESVAKKETDNEEKPRVSDASSTRHGSAQVEGEGEQGIGKKDKRSCAEIKNLDATPQEPPVISLPLVHQDGFYPVSKSDLLKYQELYPALDVMQELRGMYAWLDARPKNRKTKTGIKAFITRWLSKSQNNAPVQRGGSASKPQGSDNIDWDVPSYGYNSNYIEGEVV